MTDGQSLPLIIADDDIVVSRAGFDDHRLDLTTFTAWLKLQPISTRVSLLHALANDLFAEGWGGVGYEIRKAAEDLHTLTRHEGAV